jgi:hypothetical protein
MTLQNHDRRRDAGFLPQSGNFLMFSHAVIGENLPWRQGMTSDKMPPAPLNQPDHKTDSR